MYIACFCIEIKFTGFSHIERKPFVTVADHDIYCLNRLVLCMTAEQRASHSLQLHKVHHSSPLAIFYGKIGYVTSSNSSELNCPSGDSLFKGNPHTNLDYDSRACNTSFSMTTASLVPTAASKLLILVYSCRVNEVIIAHQRYIDMDGLLIYSLVSRLVHKAY